MSKHKKAKKKSKKDDKSFIAVHRRSVKKLLKTQRKTGILVSVSLDEELLEALMTWWVDPTYSPAQEQLIDEIWKSLNVELEDNLEDRTSPLTLDFNKVSLSPGFVKSVCIDLGITSNQQAVLTSGLNAIAVAASNVRAMPRTDSPEEQVLRDLDLIFKDSSGASFISLGGLRIVLQKEDVHDVVHRQSGNRFGPRTIAALSDFCDKAEEYELKVF